MKILLADDSMTAQNLGKKILLDAGYEVIAVSNGAVAMKKIASEKPDLLILDVFMPGYTGLELCQKVKGSPDTAKTPVLLTVGKMEPFRAEEGSKVGADGVIIKPFEASDLIATIQKLAAKAAPKKDSVAERTMKLKPLEDFKDESYQQWKTDEPTSEPTAKLQVPQEMAGTAAYDEPAFDVQPPQAAAAAAGTEAPATASPWLSAPVTSALEATSPEPPAWNPASTVVEAPPTPPYFGSETGSETAASSFEVTAPGAEASAAAAPSLELEHNVAADFSAPAPPAIEFASFSPEPAPAEAQPELESTPQPDFSSFGAPAPPPGFETTAAPPVEVAVSAPAGFEPTIPEAAATPVIVRDPALATGPTNVSEFATSFGVAEPEVAAPAPELELEVSPSEAAAPAPVVEPALVEPASAERASVEPEFGAEVSASPFQAAPEPEAPPAPEPSVGDQEFAAALHAAISDAPVAAPEPQQPVESHSFSAASDSSPVSAAADSSPVAGFDPAAVARAVDRVLDRFKAEVMAEIQRELRR